MSRLTRNILSNLAGQVIVLVLGFVAVRFIYRDLGDDAVGIIFFALTLNSVLAGAMDLGISSTIVREVARTQLSSGYVVALLRTAGLFYWGSYAALTAMLVLAAETIVRVWLNVGTLDPAASEMSLRILAGGSLLALPKSLYASLFKGLQRMDVSNGIDALSMAVQQGGIAAIISLGGGLVAVSWWIAGSTAVGVAAYAIAASRVVPVRALLPGIDRQVIRLNRGYASRVTIVTILGIVLTHADKLIVSALLPLGVFGLYGFAFSALNRGTLLTSAVAQAAFPSLSALHSRRNHEGLLVQYRSLQNLVCYMSVPVFAVTPFAVPGVFGLLFGSEEADQMFLPSTLLALGFYRNSTLHMPYMLSLAVGRPAIAVALNAWAVATVLPTALLLVWRWGLIGAGSSWLLYQGFAYLYFVPRISRECAGEAPWRWYRDVARFTVPACVIYSGAWLGALSSTDGSALGIALAFGMGTAVYVLVGWRALPTGARVRLRRVLRTS
jgi:O-antigen/teichoic acid export membrane protein